MTDPKKIMTKLTRASGLKPNEWAGKCYQMACCLTANGIVKGVAVYGHWRGPVAKGTMFDRGLPFVPHGWVKTGWNVVVDPTRWVFERKKPYIYLGIADHYDEGGNVFRSSAHRTAPSFAQSSSLDSLHQLVVSLDRLPRSAWDRVQELLLACGAERPNPERVVTVPQLFWLANQHPSAFLDHAPAVYRCIDRIGRRGLIPIDNWRMVERGDWLTWANGKPAP